MTDPKIPQIMPATGKIDPSLIPYLSDPVPASLDAVTDLNTVIAGGVYFQATSGNATAALNYPEVQAGILEVKSNGGTGSSARVWQRYTPYQTYSTRVWVRTLDPTSTWSTWHAVGEALISKLIGASADLNSYQTSGSYLQSSDTNAAGGANYPAPYAGTLEVTAGPSGWVFQRYTTYAHGNAGGNRVYHRSLYSGTWSAWQSEQITALISGTNTSIFKDICAYYNGNPNVVGNVVIDTPISVNSAQMIRTHIRGYNYLQGWSDVDLTVDFYCYAGSSTIINATSNTKGTLPVKVRLGVAASGNVSIILTSLGPSGYWQYPQIVVSEVITGFTASYAPQSVGWTTRLVAEANIASTFTGIVTCATKGTGTITYAGSGNYRAASVAGRKVLELFMDTNGYAHLRGVFENAVAMTGWSANIQFPVGSIPTEWLPATDIEAPAIVNTVSVASLPCHIILRGTNSTSDFSGGGGSGTLIWQALQSLSFSSTGAGNIFWSINEMVWQPGV